MKFHRRHSFLAIVLLVCAAGWAQTTSGPQPIQGATPAPSIAEEDKAFAESLAGMTLEQAKAAIAQADQRQITSGVAQALRERGNAVAPKQPGEAVVFALKALAVADRLNDPLLTAKLLLSEGLAHRAAGDNEAALAAYDQSASIYEVSKTSPIDLAQIFGARAIVRMRLGDLDGAVEDGDKALTGYQQMGDQVGMARTLNNLGNAELALAHFREAREDFEQGLKLARAQKQRQGEAYLLTNIGNTYLQQDNYALATDYCLQAVKIKEELGNQDDLVTTLVSLARIYKHGGKDAEAMQTMQRAWSLAQESNRPRMMALVLSLWGEFEEDDKHYDVALTKLNQGIAYTRQTADRLDESEMLEQIAEVELLMQHYDDAIRDAKNVAELAGQMGVDLDAANAATTLAKAELGLGHQEEARSAFESSIAIIERMRDNVAGGDQARSDFFALRTDVYKSLAAMDASEGRWNDSLLLSEREKGRALLDMLTQGKASVSTELSKEERAEEKALRARLSARELDRSSAVLVPSPDEAHLATLDAQLAAARNAIAHFRERMYAAHPDLSRQRGDAPLIASVAQTEPLLPSASAALLEYEVTAAATYLFVVTRGPDGPVLHGYTLPIAAPELHTRVLRFQTALTQHDPGFAPLGRELYRILLAPAHTDLLGKTSLIVIPSGDLWHLPFQALQGSSRRYLIDDATLSYAPSLSILLTSVGQPRSAPPSHKLLAIGDPAGDLPEAADEVKALARLYGSGVRSYIGSSASKENFEANVSSYDIVHLATHGVFDDRNPMYSHILLASSGKQSQMIELDAAEIAEMKIPARLVVLSACQTAEGKYQAGEGLIGLSWSFLAAGSQSAVASQWRVASSSTTGLMIAFHRGLQQHMSPAAALRHAELTIEQDPRYRHPFYWAGFVLLGG